MGPLDGYRVLEVAGIGPGPFAATLLADMGADVLRVERPGTTGLFAGRTSTQARRGRAIATLDLKAPADRRLFIRLAAGADALIEGFRPGAMEGLGLAPDDLVPLNRRLVYARVTGYGQDGPLSGSAGHDINYISLSGALGAIAREGERPLFPLNLLGDYAGGGMLAAFGIVCALLEARASGQGQVVDAAMLDGVAQLTGAIHGLSAAGLWSDRPGTNLLDSGAHFYEVYETSDGGHMAVGAIEPQFYAELLRTLEVDEATAPQWDRDRWRELKVLFASIFVGRSRAEWEDLFDGVEACVTPVLGLEEAVHHPHNVSRGTFATLEDGVQPTPAPRFGRTEATHRQPRPLGPLLRDFGLDDAEARELAARSDATIDPQV